MTDAARRATDQHARVAACGEGASTLWAHGHVEAAIQLEHLWDEIAKSRQMDILCAYPLAASRRKRAGSEKASVRSTRPSRSADGEHGSGRCADLHQLAGVAIERLDHASLLVLQASVDGLDEHACRPHTRCRTVAPVESSVDRAALICASVCPLSIRS